MTKDERIRELEKRIARLEARIATLESRPATPPTVVPSSAPWSPNRPYVQPGDGTSKPWRFNPFTVTVRQGLPDDVVVLNSVTS